MNSALRPATTQVSTRRSICKSLRGGVPAGSNPAPQVAASRKRHPPLVFHCPVGHAAVARPRPGWLGAADSTTHARLWQDSWQPERLGGACQEAGDCGENTDCRWLPCKAAPFPLSQAATFPPLRRKPCTSVWGPPAPASSRLPPEVRTHSIHSGEPAPCSPDAPTADRSAPVCGARQQRAALPNQLDSVPWWMQCRRGCNTLDTETRHIHCRTCGATLPRRLVPSACSYALLITYPHPFRKPTGPKLNATETPLTKLAVNMQSERRPQLSRGPHSCLLATAPACTSPKDAQGLRPTASLSCCPLQSRRRVSQAAAALQQLLPGCRRRASLDGARQRQAPPHVWGWQHPCTVCGASPDAPEGASSDAPGGAPCRPPAVPCCPATIVLLLANLFPGLPAILGSSLQHSSMHPCSPMHASRSLSDGSLHGA